MSWNRLPWKVKALYGSDLPVSDDRRVGLLGIAALNGGYTSSKAKELWETDSEQVL